MAVVRQDHVINSGSILASHGPGCVGCDYPTDPRTGLSESMASPLRSGPNVGRLAERSTNLGARPLPNQSGDSVNDEGPGRLSVRHTQSRPRGNKFTRPAWALVGPPDLSSVGNRCCGRFTLRISHHRCHGNPPGRALPCLLTRALSVARSISRVFTP